MQRLDTDLGARLAETAQALRAERDAAVAAAVTVRTGAIRGELEAASGWWPKTPSLRSSPTSSSCAASCAASTRLVDLDRQVQPVIRPGRPPIVIRPGLFPGPGGGGSAPHGWSSGWPTCSRRRSSRSPPRRDGGWVRHSAAVAVARVAPRAGLATRLPAELLPRTRSGPAASPVRAVLTIGAATGETGRADALEAATVLWWRCEDDRVAGGSGFPGDLTEGYLVLEGAAGRPGRRPTAPDPDGAVPVHRIDLDVAALVWPRTVTPRAGDPIGPILVRLGGPPSVAAPVASGWVRRPTSASTSTCARSC